MGKLSKTIIEDGLVEWAMGLKHNGHKHESCLFEYVYDEGDFTVEDLNSLKNRGGKLIEEMRNYKNLQINSSFENIPETKKWVEEGIKIIKNCLPFIINNESKNYVENEYIKLGENFIKTFDDIYESLYIKHYQELRLSFLNKPGVKLKNKSLSSYNQVNDNQTTPSIIKTIIVPEKIYEICAIAENSKPMIFKLEAEELDIKSKIENNEIVIEFGMNIDGYIVRRLEGYSDELLDIIYKFENEISKEITEPINFINEIKSIEENQLDKETKDCIKKLEETHKALLERYDFIKNILEQRAKAIETVKDIAQIGTKIKQVGDNYSKIFQNNSNTITKASTSIKNAIDHHGNEINGFITNTTSLLKVKGEIAVEIPKLVSNLWSKLKIHFDWLVKLPSVTLTILKSIPMLGDFIQFIEKVYRYYVKNSIYKASLNCSDSSCVSNVKQLASTGLKWAAVRLSASITKIGLRITTLVTLGLSAPVTETAKIIVATGEIILDISNLAGSIYYRYFGTPNNEKIAKQLLNLPNDFLIMLSDSGYTEHLQFKRGEEQSLLTIDEKTRGYLVVDVAANLSGNHYKGSYVSYQA